MGYRPIELRRAIGLSSLTAEQAPEGASETYKEGAILVDDGNGRVQEGGADPLLIVGIATQAGQNNATEGAATARFNLPLSQYRFEMTIDTSGGQGTGAIAATDMYTEYGVAKDATTGFWYVDKAEATKVRVVITKFIDPVGTVQGRVEVAFLQAQTIFGQAVAA